MEDNDVKSLGSIRIDHKPYLILRTGKQFCLFRQIPAMSSAENAALLEGLHRELNVLYRGEVLLPVATEFLHFVNLVRTPEV